MDHCGVSMNCSNIKENIVNKAITTVKSFLYQCPYFVVCMTEHSHQGGYTDCYFRSSRYIAITSSLGHYFALT